MGLVGRVNGNAIEFSFETSGGASVVYTGAIDGRTMAGTCAYGEAGGPCTWEVRRARSFWEL